MLVTADRGLAGEVRALETEEEAAVAGGVDVDTLLFQLAASEEYSGGGEGQRQYAPEDLTGGLRGALVCKASLPLCCLLARHPPVLPAFTLLLLPLR